MKVRGTLFFFLISFFPTLFAHALYPHLPISYFAPLLVFNLYRAPLLSTLWLGFLCGGLLDLLNLESRFGIGACSYVVTLWFLYGQRQRFFEDSWVTLPLMSALFVFISLMIQAFLQNFLGAPLPIHSFQVFSSFFTGLWAGCFYGITLWVNRWKVSSGASSRPV